MVSFAKEPYKRHYILQTYKYMSHTETHSKKTRPATRRRRTPRLLTLRTSSKFTCSRPRGVYLFICLFPSFPPIIFSLFVYRCSIRRLSALSRNPHARHACMSFVSLDFFHDFFFSFLCVDALSADFSRLSKICMLETPLHLFVHLFLFDLFFQPESCHI